MLSPRRAPISKKIFQLGLFPRGFLQLAILSNKGLSEPIRAVDKLMGVQPLDAQFSLIHRRLSNRGRPHETPVQHFQLHLATATTKGARRSDKLVVHENRSSTGQGLWPEPQKQHIQNRGVLSSVPFMSYLSASIMNFSSPAASRVSRTICGILSSDMDSVNPTTQSRSGRPR